MARPSEYTPEKGAVYGLVDPLTNELRYIGWSVHPRRRYGQHCRLSEIRRARCRRSSWLVSLQRQGHRPELVIIEESPADWQEAERFWIAYFRAMGAHLTNDQEGGEMQPSALVRKSAASKKGYKRTPLHQLRMKMAAINREGYGLEAKKRFDAAYEKIVAKCGSRAAADAYINERLSA